MSEIMHIVLKYNDRLYSIDTIEEHKTILLQNGNVIWGIIRSSQKGNKISIDKIRTIKSQINEGISTHAFLATRGKIKAKCNIVDILSNDEVLEKSDLVPEYYKKDIDRCVAGILIDKIEELDSTIIDQLQQYKTDRGNVALGNQTNPLYVSFIMSTDEVKLSIDLTELVDVDKNEELQMKEKIKYIYEFINSKGFIFSYEDISNFYLSIKTKPFVILAGISGTGKSKLVELFSTSINANTKNNRFNLISVKPDWSDSTELFGYKNINDEFISGSLVTILEDASKPENLDKPYFICLDEMNLARVEYYLSEYLSLIESRHLDGKGRLVSNNIFPEGYLDKNHKNFNLKIPENIFIIGTVNMDDTTFSFSKKVLDRANTIEFSEIRLDLLDFLDDHKSPISIDNKYFKTKYLSIKDAINDEPELVSIVNNMIIEINDILTGYNRHFGYRVRDQIIYYMLENKKLGLLHQNVAFDYQIMQKILPSISGSDMGAKEVLIELYNYCNPNGKVIGDIDYIKKAEEKLEDAIYINSAKKILVMLRGYEDGYVSFW